MDLQKYIPSPSVQFQLENTDSLKTVAEGLEPLQTNNIALARMDWLFQDPITSERFGCIERRVIQPRPSLNLIRL